MRIGIAVRDHYEVLGVARGCSISEIKEAFRAKSRVLHPQSGAGSEDAFKELAEAYKVLSDKKMRAAYDLQGHAKID